MLRVFISELLKNNKLRTTQKIIMTNIMILLFTVLTFTSLCTAQRKAVTESGDEVILYDDGTWKYPEDFKLDNRNTIKTNSTNFHKSSNATFLLKAKNGNVGFWIDPKKWRFGKAATNHSADFELDSKNQSLQGLIISEPVEIPIESFEQIALQNGKAFAPDLKILHKEYRTVNGLKVLHLQMEGTQMGVKFSYYSYYFSNSISSIQFVVFSYSNIIKKYTTEADELLNGIVEIKSGLSVDLKDKDIKSVVSKDAVPQGSFSPNNDCKQYFEGKWSYPAKNQNVDVERTFNETTEYVENRKYLFEYSNEWIDDCRYKLILRKTTKPNFSLMKIGEVITIVILEIDTKEMRYAATFRGTEVTGEMTRLN